jgi:hypothetical protein
MRSPLGGFRGLLTLDIRRFGCFTEVWGDLLSSKFDGEGPQAPQEGLTPATPTKNFNPQRQASMKQNAGGSDAA